MDLHFLSNIVFDDKLSLGQKISSLKENYFYYQRLKKLVRNGEIYHGLEDKKITNN